MLLIQWVKKAGKLAGLIHIKENILTVRYPHSTQIHSNYFKDKIYENKNEYIENCIILTGSKHDLPALSNNWNLKNIKIVGYPRYEKNG